MAPLVVVLHVVQHCVNEYDTVLEQTTRSSCDAPLFNSWQLSRKASLGAEYGSAGHVFPYWCRVPSRTWCRFGLMFFRYWRESTDYKHDVSLLPTTGSKFDNALFNSRARCPQAICVGSVKEHVRSVVKPRRPPYCTEPTYSSWAVGRM